MNFISFVSGNPPSLNPGLASGSVSTAAIAGLALLETACSGYESAPTTAFFVISGSALGAATLSLAMKRFRSSRAEKIDAAMPAPQVVNHGNTSEVDVMEDLNRILEADPRDTSAYYTRALARVRRNDLEGAIEDLTRIIEIDPKDLRARVRRGSVKFDLGDHRGAIEDHTETLAIDPIYSMAYFHRAQAEAAIDLLEEARRDYAEVKKRGGHAGISIFAERGLQELEKRIPA